MKKLLLVLAVAFLGVFAQESANAQALKIGVCDVEKIVREMPEAMSADKVLKDLQKAYQDTLQTMQQNLLAKAEAYQKQRGMMSADKQKQEEDAIRQAEQNLYQYRDTKFGEINVKRNEYLEPIRKKVTDAIDAVAKAEKLNFVLDKANAGLLYSEDKSDITFKVIDKIKTGSK